MNGPTCIEERSGAVSRAETKSQNKIVDSEIRGSEMAARWDQSGFGTVNVWLFQARFAWRMCGAG